MDMIEVAALRHRLGLSQAEFAAAYRLPIGTIRAWEHGRTVPRGAGLALLRAIEREPETMRRLLA